MSTTEIFLGHDGSAPGYRSVLFYQPDKKLTLAIMTNYYGADIYALAASPSETLFASAGFEAATNADIDRENAVVLANYETVQQERVFEQFAPVADLEFLIILSQP